MEEKYLLNVDEACEYFGIGHNKMRELLCMPNNEYTIMNGKKYLLNKKKFEKYLDGVNVI